MKKIIGGMVMALAILNTEYAQSNTVVDQENIVVRIKDNGLPPFSQGAPVASMYAVITPILGQLIYMTDSYDLRPGLLESFNWDFKDKAYTLKLRSGLVFHNGRKVDSKDLEFTLLRGFFSKKPSFASAFINNIEGSEVIKPDSKYKSGMVSGVRVIDERTVKVKLKEPNPSFLHSIARAYYSLVPMEELQDNFQKWKKHPVGAGEYKVAEFNHAKGYLKAQKADNQNKIITFVYGDNTSSADIHLTASPEQGFDVIPTTRASRVTGLFLNYQNSVSSNLEFRKALDLAIKRSELISGVDTYKATNEFLASHFSGRVNQSEAHSPSQAKNILSKVKGLDLTQTHRIPVFGQSLETGEYSNYLSELRTQLKNVGLKVKFYESKDKFFSTSDNKTLFRILSLGADVADPVVLFGLMRGEKSPLIPHFPKNDDKFEKLYANAQMASTLDQRVLAIKELSKHLYENKWTIPLFEKQLLVSAKKGRFKSFGKQQGGLTFYVDRLQVKR